jgi:crotonobetainyl-CoA:carnitine CoA-transferase CaiB-like acyl-CoA transferase
MAAHTVAEIRAACAALGSPDPDHLPAAVAGRPADQVVSVLAGVGVGVERVRLNQREAFFASADNEAAGLIARYPHEAWGAFEQPGSMWHLGDLDTQLHRAPPVLGQHTVEVLTEVGVDRPTIEALLAAGVASQWS